MNDCHSFTHIYELHRGQFDYKLIILLKLYEYYLHSKLFFVKGVMTRHCNNSH